MSVILTGMDMPRSCRECSLMIKSSIGDYCIHHQNAEGHWISNPKRRMKDCPLKSVDGLFEKIAKEVQVNPSLSEDEDYIAYNQGLEVAIQIIKKYCGMEAEKED